MQSIRELYRIGQGPSSSHTIGPRRAAERFRQAHPQAPRFRVTLYGSLAATGKGHMTDAAIANGIAPLPVEILWEPQQVLPFHPNGMRFEALDETGAARAAWTVYSTGGGAIVGEDDLQGPGSTEKTLYPLSNMREILKHCTQRGIAFWEYVENCEGPEIWEYLAQVKQVMWAAIERGIHAEGVLPGGLGLARRAWMLYRKMRLSGPNRIQPEGFTTAYALAVAEENAAGGEIVTAPTCGSCGVLPAVLHYVQENIDCHEGSLLHALATAGLVGNLIKHNASISGAEVGCQGEIGAACAMAAAAATQLLGGTVRQVEYAAEMGLEHHLGLTCDPVDGLVQIPCIERNVFAATRALDCANFANFSDGSHRVSFDEVVKVMKQTGHDLPSLYRETAFGGLAKAYRFPPREQEDENAS
jgi:L-serine dehydratase